MPLVDAKCTNCGGTLQVDSAKEAAVCPFCGSAFIVEKAIQNFNITNNVVVNNNVQADVVNIYNSKKDDFLIEGGLLKKYKGADTEVAIPEGVVEIGKEPFAGMKYITKVVFPKSLRKIKEKAFENCTSLKAVEIGDDVTIETNGFYECSALKSLILGNNAVVLYSAFWWCDNVKTIYCGDGCTFERNALKTDSLTSISIGTTNYVENWIGHTVSTQKVIDLIEIRENAILTPINPNSIHYDLTLFANRIDPVDPGENPVLSYMHIRNLKIGNNVQLSAPLFFNCQIENLSVGSNVRCNGQPLGVNVYKKYFHGQVQTAVFADAADLERNAAQRVKKAHLYRCSVQKNVLLLLGGPKNKACKFILKKGTLQTCICCGKKKFALKNGNTVCKKCGATYVFENPNG